MAKRIKGLRQKLSNAAFGSITPIGADAVYVDLQNGKNVEEVIGDYDDSTSIADKLVTMRGASGSIAGIGGLVPAPAAGDEHKVLQGDGTWGENIKNFVGSMAAWEALPLSQKLLYDTADIKRNYLIQYFANGGLGSTISDEVVQGDEYEIRENEFNSPSNTIDSNYSIDPFDPGHQYKKIYSHPFDDWNTQSDGSGVNYQEDEDIIVEQALNLYAQWDTEDSGEFTDEQYYLTVNPDEHVASYTQSQWSNKNTAINVAATAQDGWIIKSGTGSMVMDSAKTVDIITEIAALKFSSDGPFTLSVANPGWDGTLKYSIDEGNTWSTWNGEQLSGDEDTPIYLRGSNNTIIIGVDQNQWTFTGKYCTGNIETLLDYQTVANDQHPTMGDYCYSSMFDGCTSLITPPELPATTLAEICYNGMFYGCTSLTTLPKLPATRLAGMCYNYMFYGCTSIKLSTTPTDEYKYAYRIPTTDTGTTASDALTNMFVGTGGTFTGTPTINTTYYTDHQPV